MVWTAYRERLLKSIEENKQQLQWMIEFKVETRSKTGDEGWVDTTEQSRDPISSKY